MRLPNFVSVSGAALLLVLLSGCVPPGAATPPDPTATFVAPYATDEEALAAAEEAYADYTRVMAEILRDGGANATRLDDVAIGNFLESSIRNLEEFALKGGRGSGKVKNSDFRLQRYSSSGSESEVITVYLCSDVSALVLEDTAGKSLVSAGRPDKSTLQATFDFDIRRKVLLVSDLDVWSAGKC